MSSCPHRTCVFLQHLLLENSGRWAAPSLHFTHRRPYREASWPEHNHRTCWEPARSHNIQSVPWPDTTGFNHSQVPLVPLRFIPEDALQNKWMVENLLPPPSSLLKSGQLAMLRKPRATEHTLWVLAAWLGHLAWSSRAQAAELAGVTDSFKGLFISVLISKECKSLTELTKGCCL